MHKLKELIEMLNGLNAYNQAAVRLIVEAYNDRRMISMLLKYVVIAFALFVYLMTHYDMIPEK